MIILKRFSHFIITISQVLIFCLFNLVNTANAQDVIDVFVKGISDNTRDGAQKDRQEAIMDAKRQACEKAGVKIKANTTVENFQTVYDYVESQAAAVLLPGFQIIDNGYAEDGTYTVVLAGKIRTSIAESKSNSEFTIIVWLKDDSQAIKDAYDYIDQLYEWFNTAHGQIMVENKTLDAFEDNLLKVLRCDSSLSGKRRAFAFQYYFPAGDFTYEQRSPNMDGSVSKHDFNLKMRAGKKYVMDVAHDNAIYFNKPRKFEESVENSRLYGIFPDNFKIVYHKP